MRAQPGKDPLRGRSLLQGRGAPGCPSQGRPKRNRERYPPGHSIAPTEFPKAQSAAGVLGPEAAIHRCMCASSGGDPSPDHAHGRLPVRAFPRESGGTVAISQPSTDPRVARWPNGQRDFCSRPRRQPRPPEGCLADAGAGITSPIADVPTRVDVACRCTGNEVS